MALEIDWTDNSTGVTYNNAYVVVDRVVYEKGTGNNYSIVANIHIYKDATAFNAGKAAIVKTSWTSSVTIQSTDTSQTYRNVINQVYNDMKQEDPRDDATDV